MVWLFHYVYQIPKDGKGRTLSRIRVMIIVPRPAASKVFGLEIGIREEKLLGCHSKKFVHPAIAKGFLV